MLNVTKAKKPSSPPGYQGVYEEGTRIVDNPHAAMSPPELAAKNMPPQPRLHDVQVNLRETPVEHMFNRGLIDAEQKAAADWFRERHEASRLSSGAIDPARIKVDSSSGGGSAVERMIQAQKDLKLARENLGRLDYALLSEAVDVGRSLSALAHRWFAAVPGTRHEKELILHIGRRVRDALDILVTARTQGRQDRPRSPSKTHTRGFAGLTSDPTAWDAEPPTDAERAMISRLGRRHRNKPRAKK